MYLENQCLTWACNFHTCKKHNWIVTGDKMLEIWRYVTLNSVCSVDVMVRSEGDKNEYIYKTSTFLVHKLI